MASAILGGVLKKGVFNPEEIIVSALHQSTLDRAASAYGVNTTLDNKEAAKADIVFLAIKPQFYQEVITEVKDVISETQLIVSIAPGKTIETITGWFGKPIKLIRTMPNTPAMVGEGVTAVCSASTVTEDELNQVLTILNSCGTSEVMRENLVDAVVSVSGISPAYIFMIIEAMADGAVRDGIPRTQAYRLAAQAVLGSAKMVLETGKHPAELKDMVCLRNAILEGMKACSDKTRSMR